MNAQEILKNSNIEYWKTLAKLTTDPGGTMKPNKETYFRKELINRETGERYHQTREKLKNGYYKTTTRYSSKLITVEYEVIR
jgi:hypothetical protein